MVAHTLLQHVLRLVQQQMGELVLNEDEGCQLERERKRGIKGKRERKRESV